MNTYLQTVDSFKKKKLRQLHLLEDAEAECPL